MDKLAFVDIETTGSRINSDRIIEIGILRVENGEVTRTFQSLINPQTYVSPFIEDFTGISAHELESAPSFFDLKDTIQELLDECIFVAHNVRFDYSFIKNEFKQLEIPFSPKQLCTVKLSRALYPQEHHHNLDSIVSRFGFTCEHRHRAFDDAKVLWDFYQTVSHTFPPDILEEGISRALKRPSIPTNISMDVINSLEDHPGVYIFYGQEGIPLYVGKSIHVKERILSHFNADHESTREMNIAQQIMSIETRETAGEMGALLLESDLIKKMQPIYNRQLRIAQKLIVLKQKENEEGYITIHMDEISQIVAEELPFILGIFKSRKQAKDFLNVLAKEKKLCPKLLGIEKTKTNCFFHKLGICMGACIKEEAPGLYNARIEEAFAPTRVKNWPYEGPILIHEKNADRQKGESHIIDKWCYLGSIQFSEEGIRPTFTNEYLFDWDLYKILQKTIRYGNAKIEKISLAQWEQMKESYF